MSTYGPGSDPARVMRQMSANGFPPERPHHLYAETLEERQLDDVYPPGFVLRVPTVNGWFVRVIPGEPEREEQAS